MPLTRTPCGTAAWKLPPQVLQGRPDTNQFVTALAVNVSLGSKSGWRALPQTLRYTGAGDGTRLEAPDAHEQRGWGRLCQNKVLIDASRTSSLVILCLFVLQNMHWSCR